MKSLTASIIFALCSSAALGAAPSPAATTSNASAITLLGEESKWQTMRTLIPSKKIIAFSSTPILSRSIEVGAIVGSIAGLGLGAASWFAFIEKYQEQGSTPANSGLFKKGLLGIGRPFLALTAIDPDHHPYRDSLYFEALAATAARSVSVAGGTILLSTITGLIRTQIAIANYNTLAADTVRKICAVDAKERPEAINVVIAAYQAKKYTYQSTAAQLALLIDSNQTVSSTQIDLGANA